MLTKVGLKQAPSALDAQHDGLRIRFRPTNANTGASTVNVNSLGAKALVREDGSALAADDLETTRDCVARYSFGSDHFRVLNSSLPPDAIPSVPRGYVDGFVLSVGTDADHDVDFSVGICRSDDDTRTLRLAAALGKQIDVDWAPGGTPGAPTGGFPSALTLAAGTWYHVFAIRHATTGAVNGGFDTSPIAANLLADATGYGAPRRLGSVLTDGSANIVAFTQDGDEFLWDSAPEDVFVNGPAVTAQTPTLSVPPDFKCLAILHAALKDVGAGTNECTVWITSPDQVDEAPANPPGAGARGSLFVGTSADNQDEPRDAGEFRIRTNALSQVRYRSTSAATTNDFSIWTRGWVDKRGKDA